MLTLVHVGCQALVEWLELACRGGCRGDCFPWSGSTSPESSDGGGVPDVCGLSSSVLLLLLSVGRVQEG